MRVEAKDELIRGAFLVDGHVHVHRCFDEERFFASALANFAAAARGAGLADGGWTGWLLFTEVAGEHRFRDIAGRGAVGRNGGWTVRATAEDASLLLGRRPGADSGGAPAAWLVLVAGRQLRTREGLEVLALGTAGEFEDGLPLGEAVAAVRGSGALAVVPWGFGKWWLGRRRAVADLVRAARPGEVFLGDNGNRARLGPSPGLFRDAARRKVWNLPGSDPLPMRSEAAKAGRYGFILEGAVSRSHPARDLVALIRARAAQPPIFGGREDVGPFLRNQVAMQLSRGRGPTVAAP